VNHQAQVNNSRRGLRGVVKIGALISVAAALATSLPLAAHHSFTAEFDGTKQIKATGSVTKLDWQNPHGWIHLTVTELCERTAPPGAGPGGAPGPDAKEEEWACRTPDSTEGSADWAFEIGSPNGLMRQGWTRNSLKAGDVVTVLGSRARDGSTNSNARSVTTADGKRMFAGSSQDATP
jgi:hypothetical protein